MRMPAPPGMRCARRPTPRGPGARASESSSTPGSTGSRPRSRRSRSPSATSPRWAPRPGGPPAPAAGRRRPRPVPSATPSLPGALVADVRGWLGRARRGPVAAALREGAELGRVCRRRRRKPRRSRRRSAPSPAPPGVGCSSIDPGRAVVTGEAPAARPVGARARLPPPVDDSSVGGGGVSGARRGRPPRVVAHRVRAAGDDGQHAPRSRRR